MLNKELKELSDAAINNMFSDIGRAKEETAKNIMEKRESDENDARKKRGGLLFDSAGNSFGEDIDLDEMERRIDKELEIARRGKLVETTVEDTTKPDNVIIMDIDNSYTKYAHSDTLANIPEEEDEIFADLDNETTGVTATDEISQSLDDIDEIFELTEWPNKDKSINLEEETEPDVFEIMDIFVPENNHAYLSVAIDDTTNKAGYAYVLVLSNGNEIYDSSLVPDEMSRQVAFLGAIEIFNCVKKSNITTLILHTELEVGNLLKRNATYGIVDEYSESCAQYVSMAKELAGKCFLRIMNDFPNPENIYASTVADTTYAMVHTR